MGNNYFEMIRDGILVDGSGGGDAPAPVLITKSVTANGTYSASDDSADGYSQVSVSVPNTYGAGDEGKVVSNGSLVSQTSDTATQNGEYDTTLIDSLTVDVEGGEATLTTKSITVNGTYAASGDNADGYSSVTVAVENSYTAQDEGKVVSSGALVAQSTHKQISANGTGIDTTNYSSVDVEVPNSYSAGDEGKVVSSGTLVSQTTDSTATNGIVDTTTISSLTVNVPNTYAAGDEGKVVQSGALVSQTATTATTNGTIDTTTNNEVVIAVPNTYVAADENKVVHNGTLTAQTSDTANTNGTVDTSLISSLTVAVPNTYVAGDEGKVVSNGALVSQTAVEKTVNGTYDTTTNNSIVVNVANSYVAADEGKVVSNGALVAQGSDSVTENGTVDTTLISSLLVNVSGGVSNIKLVPYWSHITNSDVYIVDSDDYIYIFGMYNADTNTNSGTDLFSIPDSFDLSKLGTYSSNFGVRYKVSNASSTPLLITIDTTTRIINASGSYSGETVIISGFPKST